MLSGHRSLAWELPFLRSSLRRASTFGTTASYRIESICAGSGRQRLCGRNLSWSTKPLGRQGSTSNATPDFNSLVGSHPQNQGLLPRTSASAIEVFLNDSLNAYRFTGRSHRCSFSTSVSVGAQAGHEELSRNMDTIAFEDGSGEGGVAKLGESDEEKTTSMVKEKVSGTEESPFVLQTGYSDSIIEEIKPLELTKDDFLEHEQFVEQSSYSAPGLNLEEQDFSTGTGSTTDDPRSNGLVSNAKEIDVFSSGEVSISVHRSGSTVSGIKEVEINTYSTTTKTPELGPNDGMMPTRTRKRKSIIAIDETEVEDEVEVVVKPKSVKSIAKFTEPPDWSEQPYVPLRYHISESTLLKKFSLRESSPLRYWNYELYTNEAGAKVNVHYCKTIEDFDQAAELFLNDKILGFDLEWVPSSFTSSRSAKFNASLMQIANETDIALFHFARVDGRVPDTELVSPTLKKILESKDILKTGVAVTGDAKRVSKFLRIHPQGIFELSDLWNHVYDLKTMAGLITRRLISLSRLTEECLYLPLDKSNGRMSNWAIELSQRQIHYAANDAYAAFRVFDVLQELRHSLDPTPKFPGCRIIPPQDPPSVDDGHISEEEEEEEELEYKRRPVDLQGPEIGKADSWAAAFREALVGSGMEPRAQHSQLKAYSLWSDGGYSVAEIAELSRDPPLKETTVVMYILEAIRLEKLPYKEERLAELRWRIPKPFSGTNSKYHWVFSVADRVQGNRELCFS